MNEIREWLGNGDDSINYLASAYLLDTNSNELFQLKLQSETAGYVKKLLDCRHENGFWGTYYYQPKWTSSHYTLLDLKNLLISSNNEICIEAVKDIFTNCQLKNGGFNLAKSALPNDICVDGMVLNYASYFLSHDKRLQKTVDLLLRSQYKNGGFAQYTNNFPDEHATICVLEGLLEFRKQNPYKTTELLKLESKALQYFYDNELFIQNKMYSKLSYPFRYFYSLLRFLNYCVDAEIPKNKFIEQTLNWLISKRTKQGTWQLENIYKGKVHFSFEEKNQDSRIITLLALKILNFYDVQ